MFPENFRDANATLLLLYLAAFYKMQNHHNICVFLVDHRQKWIVVAYGYR
jgi:hypothetical protein